MDTRKKTNQDEIDELLSQAPNAEVRKAQMAVDLGLFGFAYGRDAMAEVYQRASEWMDRDEADPFHIVRKAIDREWMNREKATEPCPECGYEECRCAVEPDWETIAEDRAERMEARYE